MVVASCSKEATIKIVAENTEDLSLYMFERGDVNLLRTIDINSETSSGNITVQLPYEGLYLIGKKEYASFPIYLKSGDCVDLEYKNNRLLLSEDIEDENRLLFDWEEAVGNLKVYSFLHNYLPGAHSVPYDEFFNELEDIITFKEVYLEKLSKKKGKFYTYLRNKIQVDVDFYALYYLKNSASQIPDTVELPAIYKQLQNKEYTLNSDLLNIPYAGNILEAYAWFGCENKGDMRSEMEYLKEKDLQQEYLLTRASRFKFYDEYQSMLDWVGLNFFTGNYSNRLKKIKDRLAWSAPGLQAPDFKAMSLDSTWVNLSDYKGKTVVVDVWATWCEPCKRMLPLFHQLEQDLKNEDVTFINVCIGTWVEMDLWREMAKEFQIENNTFFVNGWKSEFVTDYHITGVPRYMVFDKNGCIVSVKAPNPSTPKLKEFIMRTLKKDSSM